MTHPIDDFGKWRRLDYGYIVRAPVPSSHTPKVKMGVEGESTSTMIYKVSTNGGRLHLRKGPSTSTPILGKYANGSKVIVVKKTNSSWYQVSTPDGKSGYMYASYLTYVRTDTVVEDSISEVIESKLLRDQPFRIYRIVPELDTVKVYARHIFYDLLDNMIKSYKPSKSDTGTAVALGILDKCESEHDFEIFSNLSKKAKDVVFENVNPIDAMLGEDGLTDKYAGELARDWYDVFAVKRVGKDTDIQIREGKNLLGISYDLDTTDVVTRIMPTGEDADGKILYLPEVYVDSPNLKSYPHVKWYHLPVSDAKEVKKGDDKLTKTECYELMRNAAKEEYEAGCDAPKITLKVDFINVADTEEYAQYKALRNIFIGDTVRVIAKSVGVEVSMRMTQYTYDCLTGKYSDMVLGTVAGGIESNRILSRQIARGSITGGKIALKSIGSGQIVDGSVGSLQIGSAAIQSAHIDVAAITSAHIVNASIQSAHIVEAAIQSAHIANASITSANIANATITSANIANATITSANIAAAAIGTAQIANASITAAKIANATITSAQIALAAIKTANIEDAAITSAKIVDAAITSAKIVHASIETAHIKDASITQAKIALLGVNTANIVDLAVDNAKIANASISDAKIRDLAVTSAKIANAAITNAKIANASVDTAKIALGAITTALIADGAIGTAQIKDASITDAKVVELSANTIKTGTLSVERLIIVGSNKSIVYTINEANGTAQLSQTTIDGGSLTQRSISADRIIAGAITANEIAASAIIANKIAAGAITTDKLAAESVDASKIKAGSITTAKVASNFGETLDISSNASILARVSDQDLSEAVIGLDEQAAQIAENIIAQITASTNTAIDSAMSSVRKYAESLVEQTADEVRTSISNVQQYAVETDKGLQTFSQKVESYMSFTSGGLVLGVVGSPFSVLLSTTRLSFRQNGIEIAYISNNKLYITQAQITNTMTIGTSANGFFDFATTPNGMALLWRAS